MNLDKYLEFLFSLNNPIYYAIIFTVLIIFVFYIFQKYILFPKVKKHKIQLKELELKNAKLMALFPELNPNPLIRIDINGIIILTNDSAKETINIPSLVGLSIKDIIPKIDFSIEDFIRKDKTKIIFHTFSKKYFSITIKGISFLNIAQLYFTDLTKRKLFEEKKCWIPVINKCDLKIIEDDVEKFCGNTKHYKISCKNKRGIATVKNAIKKQLKNYETDKIMITNRQKEALKDIVAGVSAARKKLNSNGYYEIVSYELQQGLNSLCKIDGSIIDADILKEIFNRFCIGK